MRDIQETIVGDTVHSSKSDRSYNVFNMTQATVQLVDPHFPVPFWIHKDQLHDEFTVEKEFNEDELFDSPL